MWKSIIVDSFSLAPLFPTWGLHYWQEFFQIWLTFHFQSVVLFDWSSGSVRQRWLGHSRDVTKVSQLHVFKDEIIIWLFLTFALIFCDYFVASVTWKQGRKLVVTCQCVLSSQQERLLIPINGKPSHMLVLESICIICISVRTPHWIIFWLLKPISIWVVYLFN